MDRTVSGDGVDVTDNPVRMRYEIHVGETLAGIATYRRHEGKVEFLHTEVDHEFEGRGLAGQLARGALDDVRARGLRAVPLCPFIASWIERHPDYADLVADR
ncbi:MAG: GNAT family N-acetyltransferase [Ilumatobacteraceae bacterium]